jgi:large subunit ribosomal protein L10
MARPEKVAVVEEIRAKVAESDATVLTEYRGLKVHELAELRAALRPTGTEYKVFKNTLARRAMDDAELRDVAALLEGPVAIAFVKGDAAAAAKALREFGKVNPALVLKGGMLGAKVLVPTEIEALADLPPRDVLLAQIAGAFQAPLVKAAGLFQALPRNLAYGVKALIDQRVAGGEATPAEPEAAEAPEAEAPEPAAAEPASAPESSAPERPAEPEAAEPEAAEPEAAEAEASAAAATSEAPDESATDAPAAPESESESE